MMKSMQVLDLKEDTYVVISQKSFMLEYDLCDCVGLAKKVVKGYLGIFGGIARIWSQIFGGISRIWRQIFGDIARI